MIEYIKLTGPELFTLKKEVLIKDLEKLLPDFSAKDFRISILPVYKDEIFRVDIKYKYLTKAVNKKISLLICNEASVIDDETR